jgi:hypothetical protein
LIFFFVLAGPGQDLFDGRDGGKVPIAPSLELEVDGLGADAGERQPTAFVGRQLVAQSQAGADEPKVLVEAWRKVYNRIRPHCSLGYRPPAPEAHLVGKFTLGLAQC